jgi:hypothetical protein
MSAETNMNRHRPNLELQGLTRNTRVTDRIPLLVHEYCLELAKLAEQNEKNRNTILSSTLRSADREWLGKSLFHTYSIVEGHMNGRDTRVARRNQTLYALSLWDGEHLKAQAIEGLIRKHFPTSTENTVLNIQQILSHLSKTDKPLLKRTPKGNAFEFADARYRLTLRAMLKIESEAVVKLSLTRSGY